MLSPNGLHSSSEMVWRHLRKWSVGFVVYIVHTQADVAMTWIISLTNMPTTILLLLWQMKIHYIICIYSINCIFKQILIVMIVSASSAWVGSYRHSWMCDAIKSCVARNAVGHSPHQELKDYLEAPLEDVDDVVAWWGVSVKFVVELFFILIFWRFFFSAAPFYSVFHLVKDCQGLPCHSGLCCCFWTCFF